jgi:hypothetical protein
MQTLKLHSLKGLLAPVVSALKGIRFLFAASKKGLATACKIPKIRENKRVLHAVAEYHPAACIRVADCAIGKGNKIPVREIANCLQRPIMLLLE